MSAFSRALCLVLIAITTIAVAQQKSQRDEFDVRQVAGPRWQFLCRTSGMIFSATVLGIEVPGSGALQALPIVEIKLHVDQAIAGVRSNQTLTIREWAGAWSEHPLSRGQHVLFFLYPPSRLGLTSPVGGALGQLAMKGDSVVIPPALAGGGKIAPARLIQPALTSRTPVPIYQLARAIRNARLPEQVPIRRSGIVGRED